MRISEIRVSRLFGLFDHVIPMNLEDRVTIIHGPNGFGKTTLLHLVDSVAAGRFADVRRVSFRDFQLTFDDGHELQVIRVDAPRSPARAGGPSLTVSLSKGGKSVNRITLPPISPEQLEIPLSYISRFVPHLHRVASMKWRDERTAEILGYEDVFRAYPQYFPYHEKSSSVIEPEWLIEFRKNLRVRFIESQRLLRLGKDQNLQDNEPVRPAVMVYSKELSKLVSAKLAEYATLSQSLDRSFPKRLVEQARTPVKKRTEVDELRAKLQQLENRRASLTQAGLLDREAENFDLASYLSDPTLTETVLPVYADDAEQKLKVFDDIAHKIELLTSIVNTHFQYKELLVSKERGFEFQTKYPGAGTKPRPISLTSLSSGEQHMLVLLYELLFTLRPDSLIMIDEPEISLHVAWQLEFLSDIQKITELTDIDVLIATHAPGIINDRMDLAVGLEPPATLQPTEAK